MERERKTPREPALTLGQIQVSRHWGVGIMLTAGRDRKAESSLGLI